MTRWTQRLLDRLHRVFDKDAEPEIALRVRHVDGCSWRIEEDVLYLRPTLKPEVSIDLASRTIDGVRSAILDLPGFSVSGFNFDLASRSARILVDGSGDQGESNGDAIHAYTSLLWVILHALGDALRAAYVDMLLAIDQVFLHRAGADWLDLHGSYYGVRRETGETDDVYLARIIAEVMLPKANNIAIANAITTIFGGDANTVVVTDVPLGYYSTIPPSGHISHYAEFDVDIYAPPKRQVTTETLDRFVNRYKAAGVRMRYLTVTWQFDRRDIAIHKIMTSPIAVKSAWVGASALSFGRDITHGQAIAAVMNRPVAIGSYWMRTS